MSGVAAAGGGGAGVVVGVAAVALEVAGQAAVGGVVGQIQVGENVLVDVSRTVVLTVFAGVLGIAIGLLHRWYVGERTPDGLPVLVGVSGVALYLNTAGALGDVIGGQRDLLAMEAAIFNIVTFFAAGAAAGAGGRLGDRMGVGLFAASGGTSVGDDVGRLVRSVGRVTVVELPEEIDDIDGYDPVDPQTKAKLAGRTLLFPRRLTVEELRERFVERLQTDFGVGHVDVDVDADGTVHYVAVGGRESGIGPTLPPGTAALAVTADPANHASPGDAVQLWTTGDGGGVAGDGEAAPSRVATAELRGTAGDVATLALDETEARTLDTERRYRLVTLPVEPRVDREFAAQMRAAAETMGVVTVAEGSALANTTVGALDVAVVALRSTDGEVEAIPKRTRQLQPGETVYAIATPDRLRRLETAAAPAEGELAPAADGGDA